MTLNGLNPGISIFFLPWMGVETLELSNHPGWRGKKRANVPSSVNNAAFFIDRTVKWCVNVRFFVSINVFLCNSARILIKTSHREDIHQFMVLILI